VAAVIGDTAEAAVLADLGRPRVRPARVGRKHRWRWPVLIVAGAYFLVPLYAGFHFASHVFDGGFTMKYFTGIPSQPGFGSAFDLSLRLALVTLIITLAIMVPTTVYIHLRVPHLRRLFDGITLLPIVIPPVVLITGVLQVAPTSLKSSTYLLGLEYAVLAMPFSYRALDAGLSAIDVKTLFEASRSLGGGWGATLMRVIVPNMRSGLLSATVLTVAMVLGEYTMASLALFTTFPVWIVTTDQTLAQVSTSASLLSLVFTWIVLLVISTLDRQRRANKSRRGIAAESVSSLVGQGVAP
jgi:putative spermidine/putrescine transport system permease protein